MLLLCIVRFGTELFIWFFVAEVGLKRLLMKFKKIKIGQSYDNGNDLNREFVVSGFDFHH